MPLKNIIALAKCQQEQELQEKLRLEELEKIKSQEKEDRRRAIESEMLNLKAEKFKDLVYKYVGQVLSELDSPANIEFSNGEFFCKFHVCHAVISLSVKEKSFYYDHVLPVKWGVEVEIVEESVLHFRKFIDITWKFKPVIVENTDNILKFLLKLILKISGEYEYFLEYKEAAQREKNEKQRVDTLLQKYCEKIEIAATRSKQKIDQMVGDSKSNLWRWPPDFLLRLYKITWLKGGFVDCTSYKGEPHFEYDSGWTFSDVPDEAGYFHFLPERIGKRHVTPARQINPTEHVTKQIFYFTEYTLPSQLMELIIVEFDVVVIRYLPGRNYPLQLLASEFPEPPSEIPEFSIKRMKSHARLGFKPCLEIKQAVDEITWKSNPAL